MPYDDPEIDDPQMLVGVSLPGDEENTREMAEAFADEFAQMGFSAAQILAMFRTPFYAGAHRAYSLLGEPAIRRLIAESVRVWGRVRRAVQDAAPERSADGRASGINAVLRRAGR